MGAASSATPSQQPEPSAQSHHSQCANATRTTFSMSTYKRRQARKVQREHAYRYALLLKYDQTRTGSLSRAEVKQMADEMLTEYTPKVGGLTDDDVDLIMKIGGENCKAEITLDELPNALAVMEQIQLKHKEIVELFHKYAVDSTHSLPAEQVGALLTDVNGGVVPSEDDVAYVLAQTGCGGRGACINASELKAALACWYCLCDEKVVSTAQGTSEAEIVLSDTADNPTTAHHVGAPAPSPAV